MVQKKGGSIVSITLRITLIVTAVLTFYWTMNKIRKSQIRIQDSIFWIITSGIIVLISLFPYIPIKCSELLGVQSPSNFVFLCMIFILLVNQFGMCIKVSQMGNKINILVQEIAIKEAKSREYK